MWVLIIKSCWVCFIHSKYKWSEYHFCTSLVSEVVVSEQDSSSSCSHADHSVDEKPPFMHLIQ